MLVVIRPIECLMESICGNVCVRAVEVAFKKPRFFRFLKNLKNLKSHNFRFFRFFVF